MKWVLFRADASETIGTGHVMRCMALAKGFMERGFEVHFVVRNLLPVVEDILSQNAMSVYYLPNSESRETKYSHSLWLESTEDEDANNVSSYIDEQMALRGSPDLIVVDHYALASLWEDKLGKYSDVLAIDDLNDRVHTSQWVLDQTVGKSEKAYLPFINPDKTKLLLGTEYALLREEFAELRESAKSKRLVPPSPSSLRVLVTLGGVDVKGLSLSILAALEECRSNLDVIVVAGGANPHTCNLIALAESLPFNVEIIGQTGEMAKLMLGADLCIGAAGSTSWERCVLGLPTINITLANNQSYISKNLDDAGAACSFGYFDKTRNNELAQLVDSFLEDESLWIKTKQAAFDVCDGLGINRVINVVTK